MANEVIKEAAKRSGVRLWEVADHEGILDSNFSRMLRHELPREKQVALLAVIDQIAVRKAAGNDA